MHCPRHMPTRTGFSLVELSIVLVILGLITGGILAGQSLIHAGELRAVATEYNRYTTALNSFRDKYSALPGDLKTAGQYWGYADPTPATCKTTPPTGTQTCDGDGNGAVTDQATSYENFNAWRQMAAAGLVEGTYSGVIGTCGSRCPTPGANIPASKLNKAGWNLYYVAPIVVDTTPRFAGLYGNIFYYGGMSTDYADNAQIKSEDAWNIDTKLDDGKPGKGRIKTYGPTSRPGCATSDAASAAEYDVTSNGNTCNLLVETGL